MKIAARVGLSAWLLLGTASAAPAQVVQWYSTSGDSVLPVVVGDSAPLRLRVTGASTGLRGYQIVVFLDRARVDLVRADSVPGYGLASPSLTPGSDQVTLTVPDTGVGYAFSTVELADLWFRMNAAAPEGSHLSLAVTALTDPAGTDRQAGHRTTAFSVCQAISYWGDLTGEHTVSSRDALVALTAAVGLPTGGMDLQFGDVDEDGVVSSRDALMILTHSIGLYTGVQRLGRAKANRCAPLAPALSDVLFFRSAKLNQLSAGDTLPAPLNLPLAPYDAFRAVWSPDKQRVLYTGYTPAFYYEIVSSAFPFTTVDTLVRNASGDYGADWSPDGTRIAFISQRVSPYAVYLMNADGTSQNQVTFTPVQANASQPVAWEPQPGQRVAFVGDSSVSCCNWGIWTVHPDSSQPIEVLPGDLLHSPQTVAWNVAGDSLYYRHTSGEIYAVPNLPGSTGVLATRLSGGGESPISTAEGPGFRSFTRFPYDWFVRRTASGRHVRILRGTSIGEYAASARRPSIYVQTVDVTPDPLVVAYPSSATLTAVVTNSDASVNDGLAGVPLTWTIRDGTLATVSPTGLRTASVTPFIAVSGSTYVVVTARGWRTDSVLVQVN